MLHRSLLNVPKSTLTHRNNANLLFRSLQTNASLRRPPLAFAFDIDGVLMNGSNAFPAAPKALKLLEGDNPYNLKIPYILLTNGGGRTEQERSKKLSACLDVDIPPSQIVQAHTILKDLVEKYANKPVLVLGGELCDIRKVAESYGFLKAYTTTDVIAWNHTVWPLVNVTQREIDASHEVQPVNFYETPISAIFVFHDPRNWGLDVQIMCDIIQSGGFIGKPYVDVQTQLANPIDIVFCNPDMLWKSDFPVPRLGQGAFKESFQAVYKALTDYTYPYVQYGKPTTPTYDYAHKVLAGLMTEMYGPGKLPSMYMIGDNPASDIAGANAANWHSVLVHTGVFDPSQKLPPQHTPTHEAPDVEEAVRWALKREFEGRR